MKISPRKRKKALKNQGFLRRYLFYRPFMAGAKWYWLSPKRRCSTAFVILFNLFVSRSSHEHPIMRTFLRSVASKNTAHKNSVLYFWLGRSDSNTRMTASESVALPLGDAPICENFRSFYLRYFIKLLCFWQAFLYAFTNFFQKSCKKVAHPFFSTVLFCYDKIKKDFLCYFLN